MRICVVGGGPAGTNFVKSLLSKMPSAAVDVFEKNVLPLGLLRYGVAPDSQKTRKMIRGLEEVLRDERVRYFGGREVGKGMCLAEMQADYDAIVLATGAGPERRLSVPGAEHVQTGHEIISWLNSHPEYAAPGKKIGGRVGIIGNGNAALDLARVLLKGKEASEHIVDPEVRRRAEEIDVKSVVLFGRGSPADACFTNPVLGELVSLPRIGVRVDDKTRAWIEKRRLEDNPRAIGRRLKLLAGSSAQPPDKTVEFRFWESPERVELGDGGVSLSTLGPEGERRSYLFDNVIACIGYEKPNVSGLVANVAKPVFLLGWARTGATGNLDSSLFEAVSLSSRLASQ